MYVLKSTLSKTMPMRTKLTCAEVFPFFASSLSDTLSGIRERAWRLESSEQILAWIQARNASLKLRRRDLNNLNGKDKPGKN